MNASPASALNVDRDPQTGVLTIRDLSGSKDDITIEQTVAQHLIRRPGGFAGFTGDCQPDPVDANQLNCTRGTTIAIDLGALNDSLTTINETDPISVAGGDGDDRLVTGSGRDTLAGGPGNDTLLGRGGNDAYFGEGDNDTIDARDTLPERIACGGGNDEAANDPVDIIAECERGVDADHDGFTTAVDCNDASPSVHPQAAEIFGNGRDEDCDGRDNVDLDVDGDEVPRPLDCDDRKKRIRPGVPEIRGNDVDENCDGRALPWAQLTAGVSNIWTAFGDVTFLRSMVVRNGQKGTRIAMRCIGGDCPFRGLRRRVVRRNFKPVPLHRGFGGVRLAAGTRIRIKLTRAQTIGRTFTFTVQRAALPDPRILCRAPDKGRSRPC